MKYPILAAICLIQINITYAQSISPAQIPALEQQLAATSDAATQAAVCNDLSTAWSKKDPSRSLEYADKAFDLAKSVGAGKELVKALNLRGDAYVRKNDDAAAERAYNDALERLKSLDDPELKGRTLHNFGKLAQRGRNFDRAKSYYEQALTIRERIGDKQGLSSTLQNLGVLYSELSDLEKSNEYYNKALALRQELGDKGGIASAAGNMASNFNRLGNFKEAEKLALLAIPIHEALGNNIGLATAYNALTMAVYNQKSFTAALTYIDKTIACQLAAGNPSVADEASVMKGQILADLGRYEEANNLLFSLLAARPEGGSDQFYANLYSAIAQIKAYQKFHVEELEWDQKALKHAADDVQRATILTNMGGAYVGLLQYEEGLKSATTALGIAQKAGAKGVEELALFQQAEALYNLGRFDQAFSALEKSGAIIKRYNIAKDEVRYQTLKSKILTAQSKGQEEAVAASKLALRSALKYGAPADIIHARKQLAEAYRAAGKADEAVQELKLAYAEEDSVVNPGAVRSMAIREKDFQFDEERQTKLQEQQQKDMLARLEIDRQRNTRNLLLVLLLGSLLGGILLFYFWRNRQQLRVLQKEVETRQRIARDLHDEVGSSLSSISIMSASGSSDAEDGLEKAQLAGIGQQARDALDSMSDIVWAINPENDSMEQVVARMAAFSAVIIENAGMDLHFDTEKGIETIRLPMEKRRDFYLFFKEAVANAARHSGATSVFVQVKKVQDNLALEVRDDGRGFDPTQVEKKKTLGGNGLRNLQSRAEVLGAMLTIESRPGQGCRVGLVMPLT
jgi:two-component system sensor histidine kinase UhpB